MSLAPLSMGDPGAFLPGRHVAQVLVVTASQLAYPLAFVVLVVADEWLLHG